jgi:hypothetical protein
MPDAHNVFISYARKDGSAYAARLYDDLTAHGIATWRDTRDLDPYTDFTGEIEEAIERATHVAVIVTSDVKRRDSFVRREIAFALEEKKPIIPLMFPNGRCPINIVNHTRLYFGHWDVGFTALLERLKRGTEEVTPETVRELELVYLQAIGQRYDHWRDLYTDMPATVPIEKPRVKVKAGAAVSYLDMAHDIFRDIESAFADDRAKTVTVQNFDELREGIREHRRVALIGDPGAGKTTTLERLAYELAAAVAEDESAPLPLFVRLGGYDGGDFAQFLAASFGGLRLNDYLPGRVFLLLDGLNEMPSEHVPLVESWLRAHPDTPAIITCRKLDYVGHKLPLQRIDVSPLDVKRIRLFIGNYLEDDDCDHIFWSLSGEKTRTSWMWLKQVNPGTTFNDFWFGKTKNANSWKIEKFHLKAVQDALREQGELPGMLGVVSNPFLLFVTIQIFVRNGEPPTNRGQLFDQFVTLLMAQRGSPAAKTRPPWIDEDVQRKALAVLAYRMQLEHTGTSVEVDWACEVIRMVLPDVDAEHILYLAASASIIEQNKTVRFVHQLLQEYFAAYEMREDLYRGTGATKYWPSDEWWLQTGWEETALLLVGMEGDATKVVRWLTPVQPTLAYRCATESGAQCTEDTLQMLYEPELPSIPKYQDGDELDCWRANLPRIAPLARSKWGRLMELRGDERKGVGLQENGLPDIDWVEIPAGEFIYQSDKRINLDTFNMARYPVTYIQFQAFLDASDGYANEEWWVGFREFKTKTGIQTFTVANFPVGVKKSIHTLFLLRRLVDNRDAGRLAPDDQQCGFDTPPH